MSQEKKIVKIRDDQASYLGRWVDKSTFRTFVYDRNGEQKLANSWVEYESMIASGTWHDTKPDPSHKLEKKKDVAISNSK